MPSDTTSKYDLLIKPSLDKVFRKLAKKDISQLVTIWKKVSEIQGNPLHTYKHLKYPLQQFKRVHLSDSFVLIFSVNHEQRIIELWWYAHHDEVYFWKPKE